MIKYKDKDSLVDSVWFIEESYVINLTFIVDSNIFPDLALSIFNLKNMKRNDWIILASTLIYSFLFYHQVAGFNFLIFTIILIGGLLLMDNSVQKDKRWLITAAIALLTGVSVFINGTAISVIANILALSFLATQTISRGSSLFFAFLYAIYSYISSFVYVILDLFDKKNEPAADAKPKKVMSNGIRFVIAFVILFILILFFILYRRANPLFKEFTDRINLDFISGEWLLFTLFGFLLLYGFFRQRNFPELHSKDVNTPNFLDRASVMGKISRFLGFEIGTSSELIVGVILIGLLNFMLLMLNVLDLGLLFGGSILPEGISYSEYVHQGVWTLIFSILLVILIIGYTFRGQLNFVDHNKPLKLLVYLWLVQNLIMLALTAYRNQIYINEYSLTYRRIGVFVWLFLTGFGLVTTWLKISGKRNNYYIFRTNGWSFFLVLVFLGLWNWDGIISRYNSRNTETVDYEYLLKLNHAALPVLLEAVTSPQTNSDSLSDKGIYFNDMLFEDIKSATMRKVFEFLQQNDENDLRSWCLGKDGTAQKITDILTEKAGYKIVIEDVHLSSTKVMSTFKHVGDLYMRNAVFPDFEFFKEFSQLHSLTMQDAQLNDLSKMPLLGSLTKLDISNNELVKAPWLASYTKLKELDISYNDLTDISCLTNLKSLIWLDISLNPIQNFEPLASLKQLRSLDISQLVNAQYTTLPAMPELTELIMRNSNLDKNIEALRPFLSSLKSLETLDLEGNNLDSYDYILALAENPNSSEIFSEELNTSVMFPKLKRLSLSKNNLTYIQKISIFPLIEELNLSYNTGIMSFEPLLVMTKLKKLDLSGCSIIDIDTLCNLQNLQWLSIAGTHSAEVATLNKFKYLRYLDMSKCSFYTWAAFKMPELRELNISNSDFEDLNLLVGLTKLEVLDLRQNNKISNYSALTKIKSLKILYVSESSAEKMRELRSLLPGVKIYSDSYQSSYFFDRNRE